MLPSTTGASAELGMLYALALIATVAHVHYGTCVVRAGWYTPLLPNLVQLEFLTAVDIKMMVFWDLMLWNLVDCYHALRRPYLRGCSFNTNPFH
jgi:hypothetical protein